MSKDLVAVLAQVRRKEHRCLPNFECCFSSSVVLCLPGSAGVICERGAANTAPAMAFGREEGWISCGEETGQVVKTLWKDLFCQLWCSGIHPKHPTPTAPAACHAARTNPKASAGLLGLENSFSVPERLAEYFLHPPCRKCGAAEQQHPSSQGQEEVEKNCEKLQKDQREQDLCVQDSCPQGLAWPG